MKIEKINSKLSIQEIFSHFANKKGSILLESQMSHSTLGKFSYCLIKPFMKVQIINKQLYIDDQLKTSSNPLAEASELFESYKLPNDSKYDFIGGFAGYLAYDLAHLIYSFEESLSTKELPDLEFYGYKQVIIYDHQVDELVLVSLDEFKDDNFYSRTMIEALAPKTREQRQETQEVTATISKEQYLAMIKQVKDYIRAGDAYQINYTQEFTSKQLSDPYEVYQSLACLNPAPFASFLKLEDSEIISSSPELFFKLNQGKIYTQPMKGTVKRTGDKATDQKLYAELKASKKDQAELLMIVDLERNDFSRICKPNSVKVENLYQIIPYATVYQQVADVYGELKKNTSIYDLIVALFPGGSITGAPKLRAMEIIDELELSQRKVYTGSIGYFSVDGNSEFNIAIRTITNTRTECSYQVGGGITWDSDDLSEYEESLIKAYALKKVIENETN